MARLVENDDHFLFDLGNEESHSMSRRQVDEGVNIFTSMSFAMVGKITFAKNRYDFAGARTWLSDNLGIEASDEQTAELKMEAGLKLYSPEIFATPFGYSEIELQGANLLLIRAVPITPGKHKGFTFTGDVITAAAPMYKEVNLVEHHSWEVPGDVKGTILSVATDDKERIVVTALITKSETAKLIRDNHFHSVSSNFLLTADDDMNVRRITRIEELTLTDTPADPDAVVIDFKEVEIPMAMADEIVTDLSAHPTGGGGRQPSAPRSRSPRRSLPSPRSGESKSAFISRCKSAGGSTSACDARYNSRKLESDSQTPPASEVFEGGKNLTKEEEEQVTAPAEPAPEPPAVEDTTKLELEQRLVALENENAKLVANQLEMAKWQKVQLAESATKELIQTGRIVPAQEAAMKQLLVTFTKEQKVQFDEFIKHNSVGAIGGTETSDAGVQVQSQLNYSDLNDEQLSLLHLADGQETWEEHGPANQDSILLPLDQT